MPDTQGRSPAGRRLFAAGKEEQTTPSLRVIGIGAGAGSLEAIRLLFAAMPVDQNMTFIICRHSPSEITDHLDTLLRHETAMPVRHAEHGIKLEANAIYLIPDEARMILLKDRLVSFEEDEDGLGVAPLDLLLHALAASAGPNAMALLLSGEGPDGLRGAVSIKRAGGLVLVQDPEHAPRPDRLKAVVEAGLASASTTPEIMPDLIERFIGTGEVDPAAGTVRTADQAALSRIFRLLSERFDLDLDVYRKAMVARGIRRRAGLVMAEDLQAYAGYLASDEGEAEALLDDLMIGVTAFFRDPQAFAVLASKVVPALVERNAPDRSIRVWVPACATGDDAYSLAILITERLREIGEQRVVEIIGTDRSERFLAEARLASYHRDQLKDLPAGLIERYMVPSGERFRVCDAIRDLVSFTRHDLIDEAPLDDMALVSCRNLPIYLVPEAQRKALFACRRALNAEGFLVLGPSELPNVSIEGLSVIDRRWRVYQKIEPRPSNPALKQLPEVYRQRPAEAIKPLLDIRPAPYRPPLPPPDDHDQPGIFDGMMEQNQQMLESTIDTLLASNDALRRRNRDLRAELQRLTTANTALEDIATLVAHDLKAPLRAVDHLTRRLGAVFEQQSDQREGEDDLRHLQLRLVGLHRLIDDLLTYARQDANNESGIEHVDLGGLIREILVLIGLPSGFRLEVRPPSLSVRTRRIPLECILRNLLGNTIEHHGGTRGSLQITLLASGQALDVRMTDDGEGMTGRHEGLSLAIVRQLLAAEGGHLDVTPRPSGSGAETRFTWPIEGEKDRSTQH